MHKENTPRGSRICFDAGEGSLKQSFERALHDDGGCAIIMQAFVRLVSESVRGREELWRETLDRAREEGLIEGGDSLSYSFAHGEFRVAPGAAKPPALETALEEAKRAAVEAQDFTAGALLKDILDGVRKEARNRGNKVTVPIEGDGPEAAVTPGETPDEGGKA